MKHLNTIAQLRTFLLTISLLGTFIAKAQWSYIGEPEFSEGKATYVSMDVHNEVPYLAYTDHPNTFRITVMKYNGTDWVSVGPPAFTAPNHDYISLKMNGSVPYIAFMDRYFYDGIINGKLTVMKFNGGIWGYVGAPGFSAGNINRPLLAMNNGAVYVSFLDGVQDNRLVVMKFDGNDWLQVGTSSFPASLLREYGFTVYNGTPYIAYLDKTSGNKSVVKKFDGTDWIDIGDPGFWGDMYGHIQFAVSENGTPFLAHADSSTNGSIIVLQFDGSEWVNVGGPNVTPDVGLFSFTLSEEIPYIVFSSYKGPTATNDVNNLTVMRYKDAEWQLVGPVDIIGAHYPAHINIVVENEVPYLGFQHNGFGGGATAMKYTEPSTSLNDLSSEKTGFRLYPNPSDGGEVTFYLENAAHEDAWLRVFDLNGNQFFEQKITLENGKTAYPVQLPDLPAGMYVTKVTTLGQQFASGKLILHD